MGQVININKKKIFTLSEANEILNVVRHITKNTTQTISELLNQLDAQPQTSIDDPQRYNLEFQITQEIHLWKNKIEKLGAIPKGLWVVDFDTGYGFYCWKHPETQLRFWHAYENESLSKTERQNNQLEDQASQSNLLYRS